MRIELVFVKNEEVVWKEKRKIEKIDEKVLKSLKEEFEAEDCDYVDIFVEKELPDGERYFEYYDSIVF